MPSFAHLPDEQVGDLVEFLLSLAKGKPTARSTIEGAPAPEPTAVPSAPAAGLAELPPSGHQSPPGAAAFMYGEPGHGARLFQENCESCHGVDAMGGVPNPGSEEGEVPALRPIDPKLASEHPETFAINLDRVIEHGSRPPGEDPTLAMPAFGHTRALTQPQIAQIVTYIESLNEVDRAQVLNPGMDPVEFFAAVAATFVLICLWAALEWLGAPLPAKHDPREA
jgi:mono/diheme cytochrome c family protein